VPSFDKAAPRLLLQVAPIVTSHRSPPLCSGSIPSHTTIYQIRILLWTADGIS
jgi:hypothetical protein